MPPTPSASYPDASPEPSGAHTVTRPDVPLSPLERALISAHTTNNTRLAEALEKQADAVNALSKATTDGFEKLNSNVPALRVVYAGGAAVLAGVFALVAFVIAGLLQLQGADVEAAARATAVVVTQGTAESSSTSEPSQ